MLDDVLRLGCWALVQVGAGVGVECGKHSAAYVPSALLMMTSVPRSCMSDNNTDTRLTTWRGLTWTRAGPARGCVARWWPLAVRTILALVPTHSWSHRVCVSWWTCVTAVERDAAIRLLEVRGFLVSRLFGHACAPKCITRHGLLIDLNSLLSARSWEVLGLSLVDMWDD